VAAVADRRANLRVLLDGVGDQEEAADHLGHLQVLARVADRDALLRPVTADLHVARDGPRLRPRTRHQVVRVDGALEVQVAALADHAVVDQPQVVVPAVRQQLVGLQRVHRPAQKV
jgi:hypothetical protein